MPNASYFAAKIADARKSRIIAAAAGGLHEGMDLAAAILAMLTGMGGSFAADNTYVLLTSILQSHTVHDGLSRDVTSLVCPHITVDRMHQLVNSHTDIKYNVQKYGNSYLLDGDKIWSLTKISLMGSRNITIIYSKDQKCAAYAYIWTL